jgi:hypothetical protein
VRHWRSVAVGVAVAAVTGAGVLATSPDASAATRPVVAIHQLRTATGSDFLSSRIPTEGAPAYSLMAPRFQYQVWDFPAGQAPAGFHQIFRGFNPATGHHFVTKDPTGGPLGPVQFSLGWLADDERVAKRNSNGSCADKTSPQIELRNTRSAKQGFGPFVVTGSDDDKAFVHGDVVEGLGFAPCRTPPTT